MKKLIFLLSALLLNSCSTNPVYETEQPFPYMKQSNHGLGELV